MGCVRFSVAGESALISVSIDRSCREKGIGTAAVRQGSDLLLESRPAVRRIIALIKEGNPGSLAVFERAGFRPAGRKRTAGVETHEMTYERTEVSSRAA